jgi:alpha/beta hydrolase fold
MPRTAQDVVGDLHALLTAADVPGPYVLVAHSLGGLFGRLYAQTYPDQVRALLFVDSFPVEIPTLMGADWPAYPVVELPFAAVSEHANLRGRGHRQEHRPGRRRPALPAHPDSRTDKNRALPDSLNRAEWPGRDGRTRMARGGAESRRAPTANSAHHGDRQRPLHPGPPTRPRRSRSQPARPAVSPEVGHAKRRWPSVCDAPQPAYLLRPEKVAACRGAWTARWSRPASTSRKAEHSAEPSSGEPDAKAGSAPSNADTGGTAPAWTASKERKPGPGKGLHPHLIKIAALRA